jgi:hypothetical protein
MIDKDTSNKPDSLSQRLLALIERLPEDTPAARQRLYDQIRERLNGRPPAQRAKLDAVIDEIERAKAPKKEELVTSTETQIAQTPKGRSLLIPGIVAVAAIAAAGAWYFLQQRGGVAEFSDGVTGYTTNLQTLAQMPEKGHSFEAKTVDGDGLLEARGTVGIYGIDAIPVDTSKRYLVKARIRVLTDDPSKGGSIVHVGVATYDKDGKLQTEKPGAHRYPAAAGRLLKASEGWVDLEGEITGTGNDSHSQFREGTTTVRPVAILNSESPDAVSEITSLSVTEVK